MEQAALLADEGHSHRDIARIMGASRTSVQRWLSEQVA